jgi:hypothetical protein
MLSRYTRTRKSNHQIAKKNIPRLSGKTKTYDYVKRDQLDLNDFPTSKQ